MPYERLFTDAIDVKIKWSKPVLLSDIKTSKYCQDDNCLYKLIGEYNEKFKLFYIGKSVTRCVWRRLSDKDHKLKQAEIYNAHKHHKLYVSVGKVITSLDSLALGDVERLLIYAHGGNADFKRFINKQNIYTHNVPNNYTVENLGFKRDGMYREVGLGMYYRK